MHKKSKHNGIIFDCNQCNMKFVDKRGLQNHMNIMHDVFKFSCNQFDIPCFVNG